ncbi:RolB family protein [Agrobacterium vitis]|uniref:RolB family protein n=1 Tax=Agrobacterium vitis TaxID=373 RepID=UPI002035E99D|nr:RolB family protein [Agrobacterium vitis]MCM2453587.1 hypothetical protein [Agrobacterium vitis]
MLHFTHPESGFRCFAKFMQEGMGYVRPIFNVFDLQHLIDPNKAELVLSDARGAYLEFVQVVGSAQSSWVSTLIGHKDFPYDVIGDSLTEFATTPCLHGPTLSPLNAIFDAPLMYLYGPLTKMEGYAHKRFYDGSPGRVAVVCTTPPYSKSITRGEMRSCHKIMRSASFVGEDALEAFIAFLPTTSLWRSIRFRLDVLKEQAHIFFSLSSTARFCCEVVSFGRTYFPGDLEESVSSRGIVKNVLGCLGYSAA